MGTIIHSLGAWNWFILGVVLLILEIIAPGIFMLWRRLGSHKAPSDQPFLNRRADAFVGRVFTLEKPIVSGNGTVAIGDTVWRVSGPDCPAGSRIKVAGVDGGTL